MDGNREATHRPWRYIYIHTHRTELIDRPSLWLVFRSRRSRLMIWNPLVGVVPNLACFLSAVRCSWVKTCRQCSPQCDRPQEKQPAGTPSMLFTGSVPGFKLIQGVVYVLAVQSFKSSRDIIPYHLLTAPAGNVSLQLCFLNGVVGVFSSAGFPISGY